MSQLSAEYVAGFVDGEGCISGYFQKQRNLAIVITIANTNRRILSLIQAGYGGHLSKRRTINPLTKRQLYLLTFGWGRAYDFLLCIFPYLHIKAPQAWLVLSYWEHRGRLEAEYKMTHNPRFGKMRYPQEEVEIARATHILLHRLNKVGWRNG